MPLRIITSATSARLWAGCLENWLAALGDAPGPDTHAARLWLAHRTQRDAALEAAADLGIPGWLDPPIHFLSELRSLFDLRTRPIGVLTGRLLLARLAGSHADRAGLIGPAGESSPARSHMLDGLVGELLAEGVTPNTLARALESTERDEFTRRRDAWIVSTYGAFLTALDDRGLYDARQVHALVAERIRAGGLPAAVGGARELHVYGITGLARRRALFAALAEQADVDVTVYAIAEPEPSEWDELTDRIESLPAEPAPSPEVVPAPDALREAGYVARRVKQALAEGAFRPSDVAVVARSGRADTARVHRALRAAGVPSTARLRTRLSDVPALRALLGLFDAVGEGWDYRRLRAVATSPYFGLDVDPRPLDFLSAERRLLGLSEWRDALGGLGRALRSGDPRRARDLRASGLFDDRVTAADEALGRLADATAGLAAPRSEQAWIDATRQLTAGSAFDFRRRLCRVVGDRYDVVRLDQRGVGALDALLAEWAELVERAETFGPAGWSDRLRRLLEGNELALSTPLQQGVQVLEAHEAALTPFRQVFLVHANDGEFPRRPRGGGVLGEADRARLRRAGLPIEDRDAVLRRERALWRSVSAADRTVITYRSATAAGVPLLPSLMVPDHDAAAALPRTVVGDAGEGEPVSRAEELRRDVLLLGRLRRGGEPTPLETPDPGALRQAVLSAFAEELRAGRLDDVAGLPARLGLPPPPLLGRDRPLSERPHAWNGRLRDPAVLDMLARRFGSDRSWSASQLQQYAIRPFDFLLARVLGIRRRDEADEETSPLASGTVAHAVLEALYRELLDVDDITPAIADGMLDEVGARVFADCEREAELWLGLPPLWALEREHLRSELAAFVAWDVEQLGRRRFRPIDVEMRFGRDGTDPIELRGQDRAGRPSTLRLRGRIDRVDRSTRPGGGVRIVDYKRNEIPSRKGYEDGALLQSALYLRAWEIVTGEPADEALFLSIARPGRGSRSGLDRADADDVLRFALSIPGRVRAGLFEPVQAASVGEPVRWQPGREVTRTNARLAAGHRFEEPPGE